MLPFRQRLSLDQRRIQFARVADRRPKYVPVILEPGTRQTRACDKEKFLVPNDLSVAQFAYVVRKRLKMDSAEALFLLVERRMASATTTFASLYASNACEDGFLYVTYTFENAFG